MNPLEILWKLLGGDVGAAPTPQPPQESGYEDLMRRKAEFERQQKLKQQSKLKGTMLQPSLVDPNMQDTGKQDWLRQHGF